MNIILGSTGQIGSYLTEEIKNDGSPFRAVIRDSKKLKNKKIDYRIADFFNIDELKYAFEGGTTLFLLTPENQISKDIIKDTHQIVSNYCKAIKDSGIKKIVGLSSIGAHLESNTGNLMMSRILEHGIESLPVEKIFVRPSYYFSNWLSYIDTVKKYGVLPTFFPEDLPLEMNSPLDVAKLIAKLMLDESKPLQNSIIELTGKDKYSSREVANIISRLMNKPVEIQSIPREQWSETLRSAGFSANTASNLIDMTQSVVDNRVTPEYPVDVIKLPTSLESYLIQHLKK